MPRTYSLSGATYDAMLGTATINLPITRANFIHAWKYLHPLDARDTRSSAISAPRLALGRYDSNAIRIRFEPVVQVWTA